ncbi:MAG: nucleotidyltransferase family protein [bacterium]
MKISQNIVASISNYFEDKPVKKVYIFGSQITDQANEDSDIDILVELDYSQPIGLKFLKMRHELQDILNKKVDLISDKAVSKYIRPIIDDNKYLIYEKYLWR